MSTGQEAPRPKRAPRVLVVEDDALQARMLTRQLTRFGYEVVGPAPTVEDALALTRGGHIDAAILDMNLRGTPSLPVAEALRARAVPFLFLTGYGTDEVPPDFRATPRLGKPVEPSRLESTLRALLR